MKTMVNYNDLSQLMGSHPQLLVFRRFTTLASRVLLSLQAELLEHEHEIQVLDRLMSRDPELSEETCSWSKAEQAVKAGHGSLHKEKVLETQDKLVKYCMFVESTHDRY